MPEEKFTIETYEKWLRGKLRKPAMPDRPSLIAGLLEKARGRKRKPTELPRL